MKFLNLIAACLCAAPVCANAADNNWHPLIGISVATEHVGAERDFNETNPGIFLGATRHWAGAEIGGEAGVFENSFKDVSVTLNGWAEWPVLGAPDAPLGQLFAGGALGVARYPNLVDEAQDLGLPTVRGFVPFAAAQITWAPTRRFLIRARATPIGGDALFVVGLQIYLKL